MECFTNNLEENTVTLGNYLIHLGERIRDGTAENEETMKASLFFLSLTEDLDRVSDQELAGLSAFIKMTFTK